LLCGVVYAVVPCQTDQIDVQFQNLNIELGAQPSVSQCPGSGGGLTLDNCKGKQLRLIDVVGELSYWEWMRDF
jgi:hypothetical protein